MDIEVGARVEYNNNLGYVRYAGQTSFAPGKWVGIELDLPRGKNAGVVEGKRYFDCKAGHGVFVRPNQAKNVTDGDAQVQRYFFFFAVCERDTWYDTHGADIGISFRHPRHMVVPRGQSPSQARLDCPVHA